MWPRWTRPCLIHHWIANPKIIKHEIGTCDERIRVGLYTLGENSLFFSNFPFCLLIIDQTRNWKGIKYFVQVMPWYCYILFERNLNISQNYCGQKKERSKIFLKVRLMLFFKQLCLEKYQNMYMIGILAVAGVWWGTWSYQRKKKKYDEWTNTQT